jgi:signal transduction histidine kinase
MLLRFSTALLTVMCFVVGAAHAQKPEFGTAAEAKAMLEKAVAAIKADKAKALAMINKGEGGFKDRDLYPACSGLDGKVTAHIDPTRIGMDRNTMKDNSGNPYGAEIMKAAQEGKIAEVSYMFPRPGADKTPVQKVAFVTKVGDQVCLVGYYK